MDEAEKARRVDTLQYQIEELRRAKLTPGEEEELTARRGMLRNAEKFLDAVTGADYALNGDDSGGGALSALRQAQDALSGVRHLDDAFGQLYERLGEAYSEVYDIAATVEDKRGELDVSPGELDRVESRMDLLYRLKKKYGATVEDMLDYQARCEAELAQIEDAGDTLVRLEQALSKAEKEARQAAQALSDEPGADTLRVSIVGGIVGVKVVDGSEDLLLVTRAGILIRTPVEAIRTTGRATQGVIVMRFKEEGDSVISMALTEHEEDDEV